MPLKKLLPDKDFISTQEAPCEGKTTVFILEYLFRCILSQRSVYSFEICVKYSASFDTNVPPHCEKKIILPLKGIALGPKNYDHRARGLMQMQKNRKSAHLSTQYSVKKKNNEYNDTYDWSILWELQS
jgi:hypothetical protein